ncbi:MAG: hypothetical protein IPG04_32795 [Polyangiaceae bacterium]|nr:hypothetical protein [Polyangiaceae bacterium]
MRAAAAAATAAAVLALAAPAAATEREWHFGASYGFAMIDFPRGLARYGTGGGAHVRYGITDAIDVDMNLMLYGFPGTIASRRPRRQDSATSSTSPAGSPRSGSTLASSTSSASTARSAPSAAATPSCRPSVSPSRWNFVP